MNLEDLYGIDQFSNCNPVCRGCSVLSQNKPIHAYLDHEEKGMDQSDILVLSDSLNYKYGVMTAFRPAEKELLDRFLKLNYSTAAAIKCPGVTESDITAADMHLCRNHLEATIDQVKPKLVFTCGNLAMKMLTKQSGIEKKRGKSVEVTTNKGHTCSVVPIYHPFAVLKEPRFEHLFRLDIVNAIERYILGLQEHPIVKEVFSLTKAQADLTWCKLKGIKQPISADIETTGLDFRKDVITTISLSVRDEDGIVQTYAYPIDHKESMWTPEEREELIRNLAEVLENPLNKKIFQNGKFDLKFLFRYGIYPTNVWDTKNMYHFLDENSPKGLEDLVRTYFPREVEYI